MSQFYTDTVILLKRSSTKGTGGQIVYTYTTNSDIKGSFQNLTGQWNVNNNILRHYKTPMFYSNWTTQIEEEDKLRYNNQDFYVVNIARANSFGFDNIECTLQYKST